MAEATSPYVRWIRRELAADPPRVPSLLITVFGDALVPHGGSAWLSTLFRLLAGFGINERAVRTGVFRVARAEGPERIAPEWWIDGESAPSRDYFRIEDEAGRRYWLYREGLYGEGEAPRWFVHGLFA